MEDAADTKGDTVVDTVYPKEGKATKESRTMSHLTRMMIPRTLGRSLRTTLRIVLVTISVPFAGRRATTRLTTGNTKSISQCA